MGQQPGKVKKIHHTTSDVDIKADAIEEPQVEFESKLEEGTHASVYKGIWNGMEVAIKQFREEGEKEYFTTELLILSTMHHPNIVTFLTSNMSKRFIVLEFIVNGTLHELLHSDHSLSCPDRISIAYDIVRGGAYLHALGVIHCDLRSANLLVSAFSPYKVKIFDFASSKILSDTSINEGEWKGNIRWQPPEICKKRHDKTVKIEHPTKVDMFSFGMTLWEITSGQIPFAELQESSMVIREIIEGHRPQLMEDPSQYNNVIRKCWDNDPVKRPSFEDLVGLFQQLDIHGPQLEVKPND